MAINIRLVESDGTVHEIRLVKKTKKSEKDRRYEFMSGIKIPKELTVNELVKAVEKATGIAQTDQILKIRAPQGGTFTLGERRHEHGDDEEPIDRERHFQLAKDLGVRDGDTIHLIQKEPWGGRGQDFARIENAIYKSRVQLLKDLLERKGFVFEYPIVNGTEFSPEVANIVWGCGIQPTFDPYPILFTKKHHNGNDTSRKEREKLLDLAEEEMLLAGVDPCVPGSELRVEAGGHEYQDEYDDDEYDDDEYDE